MPDETVRSIETFCVDATGTVYGLFPPGAHVFPIGAREVVELDSAVRAAASQRRLVVDGRFEELFPSRIDALDRYLRDRLPAFVTALMADQDARTAFVAATRARALSRVEAFEEFGAPAALIEDTRRFAAAAGAPGWRPVIDPDQWLPDTVQLAGTADDASALVVADMSTMVLAAALCAVGPAARSVPADDPALEWHRLGDGAVRPEPGPEGTVAVGLAVYDDAVERLDYALTADGGALLAVTLAAKD